MRRISTFDVGNNIGNNTEPHPILAHPQELPPQHAYLSPRGSPFLLQQHPPASRFVTACTRSSAGTTRSFARNSNCAAFILGLLWLGSQRSTRPAMADVSAATNSSRSAAALRFCRVAAARHGCHGPSRLTTMRGTTTTTTTTTTSLSELLTTTQHVP